MRVLGHLTKAIGEDRPIIGKGMNQVREVLPFHHTDILQPVDRIIAQLESLPFDACEPSVKTRQIEGSLFASVDQCNRPRGFELRTATLRKNRNDGRPYRG